MTRLFCVLLTLLISLSGPAMGGNGVLRHSSIAARGGGAYWSTPMGGGGGSLAGTARMPWNTPSTTVGSTTNGGTMTFNYSFPAAKSVATPYGAALQSEAAAAAAARAQVTGGSTLYRVGTTGRSAAGEAQFWALEHPSSPGFASRYGLPAENVAAADFIETATLRPGTPFITRPAPGIGTNAGGGIEVVVPSGGVRLDSFHYSPNILGH